MTARSETDSDAEASDGRGFDRGQTQHLRTGCTAKAQQRLLATPSFRAGRSDRERDQQRQNDARNAEEQEQDSRIERVGAHRIKLRGEIVGERGTARNTCLEIVRSALRLDEGSAGVRRQDAAIKADMDFGSDGIRPRG